MISFITSTIDNPWTDYDVRNYERNGSQRDKVQYNSYYNWRIKLTDKNMFLCSLKTNDNDYKNIYIFAVTRNLFYFMIFIPQLEIIKKLNSNKQVQKFVTALPLTSKCLSSSNKELNLNEDILFLDGSCMMVKVNAPVDGFLFPRNISITNNVIKKQYALLNNLYFQFEREFDGFERMIGEYNTKLQRKIEEQQKKIKRILVRKGVRLGISLALAGVTGGLSLGIDALFDLGDIADIQDIIDIADVADMAGGAIDAFDAYDILDADVLDFSVEDMEDINISDVGEGDDLLADSYNVSFGYHGERYDEATVKFLKDLDNYDIDLPPNVDHNGKYFDRSYDGGLKSIDKSIIKDNIIKAYNNDKITKEIKDKLIKELGRC